MKIGVFDSGIGGKSIANSLQADYPEAEVIYVNDKDNVPYGSRSLEEIMILTDIAIQPLIVVKCDVIVIACNTATAATIEALRFKYPTIPFIGLEPMVKPASKLTKTGTIAICATPFTLSSYRYLKLKEKYASTIKVIEPDCSDWAYLIENNHINTETIDEAIKLVYEKDADVIVLACTHYHWIKEEIKELTKGKAIVIDPSEAISRRVASVLKIKT